jgi:ATP-binding cassette subfamily B protein/subfamily B ATP-binding cassette protein MsbA
MSEFGGKILGCVRPYTSHFVAALLQIFIISGVELLKPWPLKFVVDNALGGKPLDLNIFNLRALNLGDWPPLLLIGAACLFLIAINAASGVLNVLYYWFAIGLGQRMVNDLRARLYAQLQKLSLAFHGRQKIGDLMMRVTVDSFAVQRMIMNGLLPILQALILLSGMFLVLLPMDPLLTLISLSVVPLLIMLIGIFNRKIADIASTARDTDSEVYSIVRWGMASIKYIQAFAKEASEHRRFMTASIAALDAYRRLYFWQISYSAMIHTLLACGMALVIFIAAQRVLHGALSIGQLLVFIAYLAQLYEPVNQITHSWALIAGARVGAERCFEILDTEPELVDGTELFPPEGARGRIEWRRVAFHYRPGTPLLRSIDLVVDPGETIALVGGTGAGKSTLVSLIARFFDPSEGLVLMDDVDVRRYRIASLRQQIAMVLQPPLVFPLSVRENIAFGRENATLEEITKAARLARIDRMIEMLPQGYDTVVDEEVSFSEGEKQCLTIARAILRDAPILVLDEPTSALDTETEAMVMQALESLTRGRTTLVIAHRLSTVRRADRILVLKDGVIAESGSFPELMKAKGVFFTLYSSQLYSVAEKQVDSS